VARLTVVIPVYQAQATLGRCLDALGGQSYTDFDVVVVDSSPTEVCKQITAAHMPLATYLRASGRRLPHDASNLGEKERDDPLVVFLDPDVYPSAQWLARLVATWRAEGGAIVGGVACLGDRWIDQGAHFAKFDKWLAGGPRRRITDAATANLLVERSLFRELGGFRAGTVHADTDLSWRLVRRGVPLWLEPPALVHHHHTHTWRSLLRERYERGRGYAGFWIGWAHPSSARLAWRLIVSVFPFRLLSQSLRVIRNAHMAGMGRAAIGSLPVIVTALYAWLIGESWGYLRAAIGAE
jgi:GT2 family glycosyltransferase